MTRWRSVNVAAGHVVFGIPALLAVPALISTAAKFGLWVTLTTATLPLAAVLLPLLLWIRYTRHRPVWTIARVAWSGLAVLALTLLALSPLWFWTGPVLAVLVSEGLRAGVAGSTHPSAAASEGAR